MGVRNRFIELPLVGSGLDTDSRHFKGISSELPKTADKFPCLLASASHRDALAKERQGLKPVQFVPEIHHVPKDGYGGCLEGSLGSLDSNVSKSADQSFLLSRGRPSDEGDRSFHLHAGLLKTSCDHRQSVDSHEHDFCPRR